MIYNAANAGADIVKFQLCDQSKRKDIESHPWKDVLLRTSFDRIVVDHLMTYCNAIGIEFMASVFDLERFNWIKDRVERWKIASKSVYDTELVDAILAEKKETFISCGMLKDNRIPDNILKEWCGANLIKYLYCISNYPTKLEEVKLGDELGCAEFAYTKYYGYSSHVPGITDAVVAMSRGARLIEKHFTLDKNLPGPDHSFSLVYNELKELCRIRDEIEKVLY